MDKTSICKYLIVKLKLFQRHYLVRSFLFALTSVGALCSGLLISNNELNFFGFWDFTDDTNRILYSILIIFLYSAGFFVSYTVRYPYPALRSKPRKESIFFIVVIQILITALVLNQISFSKAQAFTIVLYGVIFAGYAIYTYLKYKNPRNMLVRNQIVWPTLLTIGLCLYYGLNFKNLLNSWIPIIPILSIIVYFVITEIFLSKRKYFVVANIGLIASIAILPVFSKLGAQELINSFLSLLFCIVTSAYLAVFETWRITFRVFDFLDIKDQLKKLYITNKYYIATLMALSISILVYPYAFIFNIYSTFFFTVFLIHALASIIYWFRVDTKSEIVRQRNWTSMKIWFGSVFLGILIIDSIIPNYLPEFKTSTDLDSVKIIGLYISAAVLYPMGKLWQNAKRRRKRDENLSRFEFMTRLFSSRMNFVRSFSFFAVILGLITLLIRAFTKSNDDYQNRTFYAIIAYAVMIILSSIFELYDEWPKKRKKMFPLITGIGATTRVFSSILIGSIVLLPFLSNSNTDGNFVAMSISLTLAAMGGFALNDFFDSTKDKVDKSHRAIPSGVLTEKFTLSLATLLMSFSGLIITFTATSIFQIMFTGSVILGVIGYNLVVRYAAIMKSFYCAFLCCLPIIYIYYYSDLPMIWNVLPLAAFFFISGRELLMDIHDIKGDLKAGVKTMPVVIGEHKTKLVAFLLLFIGVSLFNLFTWTSFAATGIILTVLIILILVYSYFFWDSSEQKIQRRITLYLWLPLLLGIVTIAVNM